ncbi:MAG TPA: hypothetical protein PK979_00845 [Bacteroidales bacterium]|nr:hypothetical protein [Bacteroidales bacterium]
MKITQVGDKSYEWSTTNSGKSYAVGNRYKGTVSANWAEVVPFIYTIKTTQSPTTHNIRLMSAAPPNCPATLTIDWGDGSSQSIPQNTPLNQTMASHSYTNAGDYTIAIFSDQANSSQIQLPQITFNYDITGENLLTAVLTPFPNMGATSFENCFKSCLRLTSIPSGIFKNNTEASNFDYCFNKTGLTSIPAEVFRDNTKAESFRNSFSYCTGLTSIPATLFNSNTLVLSFFSCFEKCTALTSIPAGLFDSNTVATTFRNCFKECSGLTGSIPAGLFSNNVEADSFNSCFSNCTNLTGSTPAGLFVNNPKANNFGYCFYNCYKLLLTSDIFPNPATNGDLYKDKTMIFTQSFYNMGAQRTSSGTAPALWEFNKGNGVWTTTQCFGKANVTNYNIIPKSWGGGGN